MSANTPLSPELLREAGSALYGTRWVTELAHDLQVSDRSIRYWLAGREIPDGIWADLRAILKAKGAALAGVRRKLPRLP